MLGKLTRAASPAPLPRLEREGLRVVPLPHARAPARPLPFYTLSISALTAALILHASFAWETLATSLVPRGPQLEGEPREAEYAEQGVWQGSIIMNGSSVANTSPSVKSKEDQGLSGHDEKENPFAEYMWMENEEDFNRQVEEELQEQDFLDRCFQEMLDEEDQDWFIPSRDLPQAMGQLQQQLNGLSVSDGHDSEDILSKSNLNPDAKEFIPGVKY
ncbi:polyadenylate-binding protein-interacting protein 2B isoform X1 [Saimiri boliviensis]|uniref:polyadenylate-binding protein-interacting protein 2B isoform X1 n=1 Tax=Saimiri boliviensis TaxID=27679 RepID=UPI003D77D9A7